MFFHLFDLAILNSYIVFSSFWGKNFQWDFWITLLGNLLSQAGQERDVQRPTGRTPAAATQVVRSDERGRKQWRIPSATRIRVCSAKGVTSFSDVPKA
jgi:hypothetical protein